MNLILHKYPSSIILWSLIFIMINSHNLYASTPKSFRENQKGINVLQTKPKLARQYFMDALRETPDDSRIQYNLGNAHYGSANYSDAITAYNEVLPRIPEKHKANTYYNLGTSYFQNNQIEDAISNFKHALQHNPQHLEAKHNLELALQEQTPQKNNTENKNENNKNVPSPESNQNDDPPEQESNDTTAKTQNETQTATMSAIGSYIKEQEMQARQNYIKRQIKPQNDTEEEW